MSLSEYIKQVCKIGQGADCCRYLGAGQNGLECFKVDPEIKWAVDKNWATNEHVAQGDNCSGQENIFTATVTNTNDESENREASDAPLPEKK